jgi:hypothetical protein
LPVLPKFALQTRRCFGSLSNVRGFLTICFGILSLAAAKAQDQERKLVDRLLRPDTTLQNRAQNKNFAAGSAFVENRGTVGAFYLQPRSNQKRFLETRDFSSQEFTTRPFYGGNRNSSVSGQQIVNLPATYPTSSGPELRNARESQKALLLRSFADQRPFLDQGKSQKSLNRQNPPLTIEKVRELLNKNK